MIYLDDVNVWLRTQKGSILKGVLCAGILAGAVVSGFSTFGKIKSFEDRIRQNNVSISEKQYQLDAINMRIENYDGAEDTAFYEPGKVCNEVALLQTGYGGNENFVSVDKIKRVAEENLAKLRDLMSANTAYAASPWFNSVQTPYEWICMNKENSYISTVPVVFECRDKDTQGHDLYALTTAVYDGEINRLTDVNIYLTAYGKQTLDPVADDSSQFAQDVLGIIGKGDEDRESGISDNDADSYNDGVYENPELEDGSDGMDEEDKTGEEKSAASSAAGRGKLSNDDILSSVLRGE